MSNLSRVLVSVLVIALLGGAYWLYRMSSDDVAVEPVDPAPTQTGQQPDNPMATAPQAATAQQPPEVVEPSGRVEAVTDNTNSDAEQGVKGKIVLPNGAPAANVPIYLTQGMMNNPFELLIMSRKGETIPPVAWGETGEDGTFALGSDKAGKQYDLRIVSDHYPELSVKNLRPLEGDWHDVGVMTLENSTPIHGRVIDEFTKAGVANATVYLQISNNTHTTLPIPGRERGIAALTDSSGAFVIGCAPQSGAITLTAEAPGYASTVLNDRSQGSQPEGRTIEIARGRPLAGVVVDGTGTTLSNVQIRAQGMSVKTPQSATTRSMKDGTFLFPCLREGPYELSTTSKNHGDSKSGMVLAGKTDVKLVLEPRPWIKLKVLTASGKEVKAYRLALMRYFPNNAVGIGKVPDFKDRRITPANYPSNLGGWAEIQGLPASKDQFCFQIEERSHAKSLSEPFTINPTGDPTEVTARLTLGAGIVGTVIDERGQPVRGAIVTTDMNNGLSADVGGIFAMFRQMMPERHTTSKTRTDAKGVFRFKALAFADYMVRINHSDFCEGKGFDISLNQEGQVFDVGTVQLQRGTIIEGFTTLQGQAAGQVKVSLSIPSEDIPRPKPGESPTVTRMPFSATAISDNTGRFRLLKRVPPGRYQVSAARQTSDQGPFRMLMDMNETKQIIEITADRDRMKIDFALPNQ